jgi:amino-acid N-acetyltransferase
MLHTDDYEAIRPLHAGEIPEVLRLMEPLMAGGNLVKRNAEDILKRKEDYVVYAIDGTILGCAALHLWGEGQAEIAALAANTAGFSGAGSINTAGGTGVGSRIINYLVERARTLGLKRVFVLTTRTQDWFELHNFRETEIGTLPQARLALYDRSRKPKLFAMDL